MLISNKAKFKIGVLVCLAVIFINAIGVFSSFSTVYAADLPSDIDISSINNDKALSESELNSKISTIKKELESVGYLQGHEDAVKAIEDGTMSPLEWKQGDSRWKSFSQAEGNTIGQAGCKVTSTAILLKMSGTAGKDFSPLILYQYMKDVSGYDGEDVLLEDKVIEYNGDFQAACSHNGIWANEFGDYSEYIDSIKAAMDAGLYVLLNVDTKGSFGSGGHFTAAVGYNKDGIIVADCGWSTNSVASDMDLGLFLMKPDMTCTHTKWQTSRRYYVYWCSKPFKNGEVNEESVGDSTGNPANFTITGLTEWMDEYDIVNKQILTEDEIALANREDCSISDIVEIDSWKQSIDDKKEDGIYRYVRASFMFVGILITVYSVLLFIAFQFDRVNNFVDVNLLSVLTLGKLQRAPDENSSTFTPDNPRTRLVTMRDIVGVTIAGIGIGVLLISGKVFYLIGEAIKFLDGFFV